MSLFAQKTPEEALQKLMEGNLRFANDEPSNPRRNFDRRRFTVMKQEPFAIILSCSDSRAPSEIIFDQGVGDLFVVRVAGNVAGALEIDSIEFAVINLHAPLILVLGHENCGAVNAVLTGNTADIPSVAALIEPAVQHHNLEEAVKENVCNVVAQLKTVPALKKLIDEKKLMIQGGYYALETGRVSLL